MCLRWRVGAARADQADWLWTGCRGFYALHTGDQWLTLTLDFIGSLLSFLVSMLVVSLKGQLGPATSALILERVDTSLFGRRCCMPLDVILH